MSRTLAQVNKRIGQFLTLAHESQNFISSLPEKFADNLALLNRWNGFSQGQKLENLEAADSAYDSLIAALAPLEEGSASPLSTAALRGLDVVSFDLLANHANPNIRYFGLPLLHDLVHNAATVGGTEYFNLLKIFLSHSATDKTLQDSQDRTPHAFAEVYQNECVLALFADGTDLSLSRGWDEHDQSIQDILSHSAATPLKQKHWLFRAIDYSNRQGFEALLDFFIQFKWTFLYYRFQYDQASERATAVPLYKAIPQALIGFVLRLALFPITAAIYTVSRVLLVVLDYRFKNGIHATPNPTKQQYMKHVAFSVGGMLAIIGLCLNVFSEASLQTLAHGFGMAGSGMGTYAVGAVLVTSIILMGTSLLLHYAKLQAKKVNAYTSSNTTVASAEKPQYMSTAVTAPKHMAYNGSLESTHRTLVYQYYNRKRTAIFGATHDRAWIKPIITAMETVRDEPTNEHYNTLLATTQAQPQAQGVLAELEKYTVVDKKIVARM